MKFQKTFLAASLAVVAVTANAQNANPVSVTEGLVNNNPIYQNGFVNAPVHGYHAQKSPQLDFDTTWLPTIGLDANGKILNLGTGSVVGNNQPGEKVTYDVFKYNTQDGTQVYRFESKKDGSKIPGLYVRDAAGNLTEYAGNSPVLNDTLTKGGQVDGSEGVSVTTGYENRQVNGEHVVYGYQGGTSVNAGTIDGTVVAPEGSATEEKLTGALGQKQTATNEIRYVQQGILANTGAGPAVDPSKNIYGVSARDNNNVVMMTGNGIALADLSNKGVLQTDGSVATRELIKSKVSGTQKTREYDVGGKRILEVYNNDEGRELASKYYEITGNGTGLVEYAGTTPVAGNHTKTGTAQYDDGTFQISKVHNTVTNKNVTYSEAVFTADQSRVQAGITTPGAATTNVDTTFEETAPKIQTEQKVSTGVIGKNEDQSNKYGVDVNKTVTGTDGKVTTTGTTITADGVKTTGYIDAADFRINGQSITASLDEAVKNATDGINQSVANIDGKIEGFKTTVNTQVTAIDTKVTEVDTRLTAQVGQLNSRVDQLNNRVDDVEKTSYRGIAIALAAQQQVPNIGAGQFAVFGGVGHYEGESAGAVGLASVFADGRTSVSAALGFAGDGEVGGRVGLAYVFGGK